MFLVFTTLSDMIVFAVVYCPSLAGNSFQRAGPQLFCSTLDLEYPHLSPDEFTEREGRVMLSVFSMVGC